VAQFMHAHKFTPRRYVIYHSLF